MVKSKRKSIGKGGLEKKNPDRRFCTRLPPNCNECSNTRGIKGEEYYKRYGGKRSKFASEEQKHRKARLFREHAADECNYALFANSGRGKERLRRCAEAIEYAFRGRFHRKKICIKVRKQPDENPGGNYDRGGFCRKGAATQSGLREDAFD